MDSRVTMALAGVLLLGAVFAGYWGIHLSQSPDSGPSSIAGDTVAAPAIERITQVAEDVQRSSVVVAVRPLRPFIPLVADDLAIEQVRTAPPGSISSVEHVLGRQLWTAVPAGAWLSDASFEAGGPLARMIQSGERAMAVAVDEVIGAAGFLTPGDYVDVLLVMQDESGNRERSAQVALPALRLLSIGEELGPTLEGKPAKAPGDDEEGNGSARSFPRTVVLAVPQQWVSRLVLASHAGTLRLAVRSAEEKLLARFQEGVLAPVALDEKTRDLLPLAKLGLRTAPVMSQPATAPVARRTGSVEVLRAGQSTWQKIP